MNTVYALIDPRDKAIRYVGITCDMPTRMGQHRTGRNGSKGLKAWVSELKQQGLSIESKVLESGVSNKDARCREGKWMREISATGADLLNVFAGGNGPCGTAWADTSNTIRLNLRKVPTAMHRALTIAAMDAGESLEQFITSRLQTLIKGA